MMEKNEITFRGSLDEDGETTNERAQLIEERMALDAEIEAIGELTDSELHKEQFDLTGRLNLVNEELKRREKR